MHVPGVEECIDRFVKLLKNKNQCCIPLLVLTFLAFELLFLFLFPCPGSILMKKHWLSFEFVRHQVTCCSFLSVAICWGARRRNFKLVTKGWLLNLMVTFDPSYICTQYAMEPYQWIVNFPLNPPYYQLLERRYWEENGFWKGLTQLSRMCQGTHWRNWSQILCCQ